MSEIVQFSRLDLGYDQLWSEKITLDKNVNV